MNYEILAQPSYSLLEVQLEPNEKIVSEAGAMAWMSSNIKTTTSSRGGMMAGLKRAVLSGESFFQNTYEAENEAGSIGLAPGTAGDIIAHEMDGELYLEAGAFLASTPDVVCDSKFQGLKGLLGEGMFTLRISGTGMLFFNAYGDIEEIEVDGSYTVDNGFAVAWDPSLQYSITRSKKIRSFLFADQLLMNFTGKGRLWVQSRSPRTLSNWVHPFRAVESKS
ncbi:TIGR00266 family protein [Thalassoglobus polymorphus]|uniref:TIGR00266 family protein n=1 Tax=Thalassoglobus polymorphus TaxID=2527994 RepID=A0A517QU51_9PLAN|nr:TIGR00266 family protein [Thalassoglobus polymorphus]QDT35118.1 hypothetical protein Mal48_43930 [Thalassoglobus polymorphus]